MLNYTISVLYFAKYYIYNKNKDIALQTIVNEQLITVMCMVMVYLLTGKINFLEACAFQPGLL